MGIIWLSIEETHQHIIEETSDPEEEIIETKQNTNFRISSNMVYDYIYTSALTSEGCGAQKLTMEGPWQWLLSKYTQLYSIRKSYTILSKLKWLLLPNTQTCTSNCLELILENYTELLYIKDDTGLHEHDLAIMERIKKDIKNLLSIVFENYYILNDESENGLGFDVMKSVNVTGGSSVPGALEPAVALLGRLNQNEFSRDQSWLIECFETAAKKKYEKLQCSCEEGY